MFYTFHVDGEQFIITPKNIYPNSVISSVVLEGQTDDRIVCFKTDVYISADVDSFKVIISLMRGYPNILDTLDITLRKKIYHDAIHFKLDEIITKLDKNDIVNENAKVDSDTSSIYPDTETDIQLNLEIEDLSEE